MNLRGEGDYCHEDKVDRGLSPFTKASSPGAEGEAER
jgi:hypothetical protein